MNRYKSLLDSAYQVFSDTAVYYPAMGKESKKVLQDAQQTKIGTIINTGSTNLEITLGQCAEIMVKSEAGAYKTKAELAKACQNAERLLASQVHALSTTFASFKREESAWITAGATLSQQARQKAITDQRAVNDTLVKAIEDIEAHVKADLNAAVNGWSAPPTPSPQPTPTPQPAPTPKPIPGPGPDPAVLAVQREALMDAALGGAPFVEIPQDFKAPA